MQAKLAAAAAQLITANALEEKFELQIQELQQQLKEASASHNRYTHVYGRDHCSAVQLPAAITATV